MKVTDNSATIPLQALLDKTAERQIRVKELVFNQISGEKISATLEFKGGFDGSSAQGVLQHKIIGASAGEDQPLDSDKTLIFTSILLLSVGDKVVWVNDRPNLSEACSPFRLQFSKEDKVKTQSEMTEVEALTKSLSSCVLMSFGKEITETHRVCWCMLDGKAKAHVADTSMQSCNICIALPSQMIFLATVTQRPIRDHVMGHISFARPSKIFQPHTNSGSKFSFVRRKT